MELTSTWYLVLSAILFSLGATGILVRRNPLIMFLCVELMLNAVNLTFVTFGNELQDLGGEISVLFVLVVAAAEVVVGLGIYLTGSAILELDTFEYFKDVLAPSIRQKLKR